MKRNTKISLVVSLLLLVLHGCAVGQAKEEEAEQKQDTVYVTHSGKKYHTAGCRYLSTSTALTLTSAMQKGYAACSVCKPPVQTKSKATQDVVDNPPAQQLVTPAQNSSTTTRQCMAYTKSGLRCKRSTTSTSGKCWQHE